MGKHQLQRRLGCGTGSLYRSSRLVSGQWYRLLDPHQPEIRTPLLYPICSPGPIGI